MQPPWTLVAGLFWLLMALLCGWTGVFYPRTGGRTIAVAASPSQRPGSMTPTQARLWLLLWTVMGLGLVGYAITLLRYAQGNHVVVPASAPFIDRAIWVGSFVCVGGGSACSSRGRC